MASATSNVDKNPVVTAYTGRKVLYTDAPEITDENVNAIVEQAYIDHMSNRSEIEYLWKYFKGNQPILYKVKEVRPEINEKIVINLANEIVSFWVGFLVGKPIQYISSVADERISDAVAKLNDMMRNEGKVTKDRRLVEWMMIAGTSFRLVLPKRRKGEKVPWEFYTLDPRNAFVVYANDYTERPLLGVSYKTDSNGNVTLTAYTEDRVYTIAKGTGKHTTEINPLGWIPIIEYPANSARLGVFEIVLTALDALNELDSNRLDAVRQFVESLLVVYNADFEEEGTTANDIRQAGMVQLKSTGDQPADIKVISEKLDQTNTETLKKSMIGMIKEIVGLPSQGDGSTGDSSNNGAVILKNGWQGAETRAEAYEAMFYEPERTFLEIVSAIASMEDKLEFDPAEVDIKFTRRNYEDILAKSQTLSTLLAAPYVHPRWAYEASGLFIDVEDAVNAGLKWEKEKQDELTARGRDQLAENPADGAAENGRREDQEAEQEGT